MSATLSSSVLRVCRGQDLRTGRRTVRVSDEHQDLAESQGQS